MNRHVRPTQAEERSNFSPERTRVSELLVAYFLRGIRSLEGLPRGQALETRRVWSARPQLGAGRRQHPWD